MFFLRFLLLALWAWLSWSLLNEPSLNTGGEFMAFSFLVAAPALYMLPTYEAWRNKQPDLTAIALLNVFLGWSVLGWVAALVWAYKREKVTTHIQPASDQNYVVSVDGETKQCPFCAEEIHVQAIKCKHCGSDPREPT